MPDADKDPRFQSFLQDLNYGFAEKLMDFCLQHSADSSWENFSKKNHFMFNEQGPFGKSAVRFPKKYSRIWLPLKTRSDIDDSIAEFQRHFRDELEIDVQDGDSTRALHPVIDTERKCDDLIEWLRQVSSKYGNPSQSVTVKPTIREILVEICELQLAYNSVQTPEMARRDTLVTKGFDSWIWKKAADVLAQHDLSVKGSTRTGRYAHIPWIRIFNQEKSPTAQSGFYLVYLFSFDGRRLYLSLNQGTTEGTDQVPKSEADLQARVQTARILLDEDSSGLPSRFKIEEIDLADPHGLQASALSSNGRQYEKGHIYGVEYKRDDLPSEENLVLDLIQLCETQSLIYQSLAVEKSDDLSLDGTTHANVNELFASVRRGDILQAIQDFEQGVKHNFGPSTQYDLIHEDRPYPPKAVLGLACRQLEGGRVLEPNEFSGGEESACFRVLRREGFEIVPKEKLDLTETNYWIFQCNPKIYDGISALRDNKVHDWSVASHKKKIKKGDLFILYVSGPESGCYALGEVTSELKKQSRSKEDVLDEYSKELELREDWSDYVEVEISHNFGDRPILKDEIKSNEIFSDFKAGNQGTNFSSTRDEYEEIRRIAELKLENYGRRFWLYAPGEQARLWQECRDKSEMFLLWDEIPNLNNFSSKEEIGKAFLQIDDENTNPVNDVLALWEFNEVMNAGDVVIAKEGRTKYLGYGIVEGEYSFDDKRKEGFHNRRVSWKKDGEWKDEVGTFATKTLTNITEFETTSPDYGTYVERLIDLIGIELEDRPRPLRKKRNMINAELIKEFETDCRNAALNYAPRLLERFTASLLAKRFLILTGLSGSGKTKLAQAFAEWICVNKVAKDPFFAGAKIQSAQKTYHVKRSDSLSVEFWNQEEEEGAIKATLPREIIGEWADCIEKKGIPAEESPRDIRTLVNETSQYSLQLHSFETHLKPAAFALIKARQQPQDARCFEIIPVGADWTSNEHIVGYPDGLIAENYVSTPALDLILRAVENPDLPHFLILDEMNLSHVERYFADMLSAIESEEAIPLYEGDMEDESTWRKVTNADRAIPPSVKLPENLFVIGTVNVDETTYMFSPKVLDRANVIEFRVGPKEMKAFLANPGTKPDLRKLAGEGSGYGKAFVTTQAAEVKVASEFSEAINKFFEILGNQDLEFGYRVAHEASRLVHFQKLLGSGSFRPNFDAVIAQKLLPKLHGSRSQLETLLQELLLATSGKAEEDWNEEVLETENPQYPLSFNKLKRMYKKLQRDQFVSFAEA